MPVASRMPLDVAFLYQKRPKLIACYSIVDEEGPKTAPLMGLTSLPRAGDTIFVCGKDGDTDVLEVIFVLHYATKVKMNQGEFNNKSEFVDAELVCKRSSVTQMRQKR